MEILAHCSTKRSSNSKRHNDDSGDIVVDVDGQNLPTEHASAPTNLGVCTWHSRLHDYFSRECKLHPMGWDGTNHDRMLAYRKVRTL